MKNTTLSILLAGMLSATHVWAVPVLQVGAPAGVGDTGAYADYQASTTAPTEADTAITSGGTLYVAGVYQNNNVLTLGGQSTGTDWGGVNTAYSVFNGHGSILLAAVPDGYLAMALSSLTVNGNAAIYNSATLSGLFPNNHDPLKDNVSDFLFFDIGNFADNPNAVPDFTSETGAADGSIKTLTLGGTALANLAWIHFDVLALETSSQGQTNIVTTIQNNPGSHDVTWKNGGGGGGGGGTIPEPGSLFLMGAGLIGFSLARRRKLA